MIWETDYGTYAGCRFAARRYGNGNPALSVVDDEGVICICSVNPPDTRLRDGLIAVKDWSENEGMVELLKKHDVIAGDPVMLVPSGFVSIGVYELTDHGRSLWPDAGGGDDKEDKEDKEVEK